MAKLQVIVLLVTGIMVEHWVGISGSTVTSTTTKYSRNEEKLNNKRTSAVHAAKKQSTPVPPGMLDVTNPPGGLTAAKGDGANDDTSAIQRILVYTKTTSNNKKIFFPQGKYLINDDIDIPDEVELHGSEDDISVITTSSPFTHKIKNTLPVSNVRLENLYFDGIRVHIGHRRSRNITVKKCVFISKAAPTPGANYNDGQLKFHHLTQGRIEECVFLRDSHAFGVGSQFYKTTEIVVSNNIFGLDLSKMAWLSTETKRRRSYWTKQKQKLTLLKTDFSLSNDQGFFKSSLYDAYDTLMGIYENVFNGSPNTGALHKDHVMYLKGFNGMRVSSNYARGWPNNASGGIKARNGQTLEIARNYLDDTGIILYIHDPKKASRPLFPGLKNVVIYGNHIIERTNPGLHATGISFYEPHMRTHSGADENIQYAANKFEFPGVSNPSATCINLINGDLTQHRVYGDNVYYGTTPPKKVKLAARHSTPSFEPGSIDPAIVNPYKYDPLTEVKLDIPTYT